MVINLPSLAFLLLISSLSSTTTTAATLNPDRSSPPPSPVLSLDYYAKTCPRFHEIIQNVVVPKQAASPTTAAALLRFFFHDCMVSGCDASLLVSSNAYNKAERDYDLNESIGGDAYDVILRAKTALEIECPGVVSCSDIAAVATRDLVVQVGGPAYEVKLGRKDGLESKASTVEGNLPRINFTMDQTINMFQSQGFTVREMVAVTGGGHSIGFVHCKKFEKRIYGPKPDPTLHPKLAERLREMCANRTVDPNIAAFLDPISSGTLDNMIFRNLLRGLGVLGTDQDLAQDPRTRPIVEEYAKNATSFYNDFARGMEKMSVYKVKTGNQGEVRRRCDAVNNLPSGSTV